MELLFNIYMIMSVLLATFGTMVVIGVTFLTVSANVALKKILDNET